MSTVSELIKAAQNSGSPLFKDAAWNEEDHPRDEEGKFVESGGVGSSGGASIGAKTAKQFGEQADDAYSEQGVADWQAADYLDQMDARTYFGNEQSFRINNGMRGGKMDKSTKDAAARFAQAFDRSSVELAEGTQLYRAVSGDFADQLASMSVGDTFHDSGYVSTAAVRSSTTRFGNTVMEITIGSGLRAMLYRDENEVLLAPGRTFTLGGSRMVGGRRVIRVTVN